MGKLELSVSEKIIKQSRSLFHIYSDSASALDLPESSFWIMYAASKPDYDYVQQEICEEWLFSKQTINSAVKNLVDKGYIYLEQASLPDARRKSIKLTCLGEKFVAQKIGLLHQMEQHALAKMTLTEQDAYLSLSQKYISDLCEAAESFITTEVSPCE